MNVSELRKIVGEEVRKVMREEFRDILIEAVEVVEKGNSLDEESQPVQPESCFNEEFDEGCETNGYLTSILKETARDMGIGDLKNYTTGIQKEGDTLSFDSGTIIPDRNRVPQQAVDPMAALLNRAKKVYDLSVEKDKERHGVQSK